MGAALDLDAIERDYKGYSPGHTDGAFRALIDEVRELRRREAQWRESFEHWTGRHDHLQRRLQKLRAGVKGIAEGRCLDGDEDYRRAAQSEIDLDDAIAKRFRKKKAVRRG